MTTDERFESLEKTVGRQRITITALVLVAVEKKDYDTVA